MEPPTTSEAEKAETATGEVKYPPMTMRYIYTFLLCYLLLIFGMEISVLGPAMVDMAYIYDVSMDLMTLTTSLWSIGYCLGALGATLFRWINRQLANAGLLTIGTISFVLLPYAPSVYVAYVFQFFLGLSHGAIDTSQNVWLIEMWHENPNPVLQLSQALYGVGSIVAPLIERPYLTGDVDNSTKNASQITPEERRDNLMFPFGLFGGLFMIAVVALFALYFVKRYVPPPNEIIARSRDATEDADDIKLFERQGAPKIWVIILAALSLGSYFTVETACFNYSATFSQKISLRVSASDAAAIQSALSAAFTVGRMLNFFIAMKLKPRQLLIVHYSLVYVSLVMLLFADKSIIMLWVANITMGYGFAPMVPSIVAFVEEYLIVSFAVGGIMMSCSGMFGAFVPYLIGLNIDKAPMSLIYIEFGLLTISCTIHLIIRFIVSHEKAKYAKD